VVIHPKYRTIGLGAKIVAETLPLAGKRYVEAVAVMAKYNPFFEKAGMKKVAETVPDPKTLQILDKLRTLSVNPVFLTSEKMNKNLLDKMNAQEIVEVKSALKTVSGVYRKRVVSVKQAFVNKTDYQTIINNADNTKLAKMLRILGFLAQTKVYLIWEKLQEQ
jgi:ABC-type ATPase with predicted acetyltransferase domain